MHEKSTRLEMSTDDLINRHKLKFLVFTSIKKISKIQLIVSIRSVIKMEFYNWRWSKVNLRWLNTDSKSPLPSSIAINLWL